ncbi:hypothetical protein QKU48_gp1185 [Fadolivirus algeromassiliense]|jgi:hypothetical protein|uniref:Uncharacterized protein n=1 Tax=Fadolivirus FV1/VV64 TaxID=3070911 RepID=A0A7D3QV69_9VIRU|nr:hypothetical protein QKU48_gp1185 [Fadolivirus algeromassiliense]QKF94643.1 hypothetical protein Fadolivirus_1_1185 [Fadolivirus FV1/VV64]
MSSSELAQLSLCHGVNYENLLASMSLVKTILECDAEGGVLLGSVASQIMNELFGTFDATTSPGNSPYNYLDGDAGLWFDPEATSPAFVGNSTSPSASPTTCFDQLSIYYYNKSCGVSPVVWNPEVNDCIEAAIALIKQHDLDAVPDGDYIPIGFDFPASANPDPAPWTGFQGLAQLFAVVFARLFSGVEKNPYSYANALTLITAFCELLKGRIEMDRKLHKLQLTINSCDL